MLDESYKFPEHGDSLLISEVRGIEACIVRENFSDKPDWLGYVEGYRIAPMILFEYIDDQERDNDKLVYPILLLWQHYIEIALKHLNTILDSKKANKSGCPQNHQLRDIWRHVRPQIEKHFGKNKDVTSSLDPAGRLIDELCSLTTYEGCKYPITKTGEASFNDNLDRINLTNLNKQLTKIACLFDCIRTALGAENFMSEYLDVEDSLMMKDIFD